jgi:glucose dehydrogenase
MQAIVRTYRSAVVALASVTISAGATFMQGVSGQTRPPSEWHDYAGGPEGARYVRLNQITKANADTLDVAWTYPYAQTGYNALVARGVIFTKGRNNSLIALDAATGQELWIHDGLPGSTERGLNYWESADGSDRRLIFSLSDYLQQIDAKTGKSITSFGMDGVVDLREASAAIRRRSAFSQARQAKCSVI